MFRYVDALCLLPLTMYPKNTHTHMESDIYIYIYIYIYRERERERAYIPNERHDSCLSIIRSLSTRKVIVLYSKTKDIDNIFHLVILIIMMVL